MVKEGKSAAVPRLRFPEFRGRGEWSVDTLADVADFVNERGALSRVSTADYVSTENFLPDYGGVVAASKLPAVGSIARYRVGDVLISNIRPYLKKVWYADRDGGASNDVVVLRAKGALSRGFLASVLKSDAFITYVMQGARGVKMPRGDVASMRQYPVSHPDVSEQQKIADCLTSLDELITAQGRKVEALKTYKRGLMQQLFPREGETLPRLRVPEFASSSIWHSQKIASLLSKVSFAVSVEPEKFYREIGIRSHGKGIFHKKPVRGKVIGEKRVFQVVQDALVLNIVFAWEQAVATTSEKEVGMIASHRFPMYVAKPGKCDVEYVKGFFLTNKGKRLLGVASPGGAGRNKTLGQKEFENLEIALPVSVDEQTRIANCISSFDTKISIESDKLESLKTHKRGLMQQLFPSPVEA